MEVKKGEKTEVYKNTQNCTENQQQQVLWSDEPKFVIFVQVVIIVYRGGQERGLVVSISYL